MSVLTKVFVVLVTLLSVALVSSMVPFVANTENWRQQYEAEKKARQVADFAARARQEELDQYRSNRQAELLALAQQIKQLERQIGDNQHQENTLRAQMKGKDLRIDSLTGSESQARADLRIQIATNSAQANELNHRRDEMRAQATKLVQLELRRNELANDNDVLKQQLRYYEEQIYALQQSKEKLEETLARFPKEIVDTYTGEKAGVEFDPAHKIVGKVTAVRSMADDTFVEVDVGKNDEVLPGMRFYVRRGMQYVGTLVITTVYEREAAGLMKLATEIQVVAGDVVEAGPPAG